MKLRSPWAAAVQSLGWAGEGSTVLELLAPALVPHQSTHTLGEQGCPTGAAKGKRCIWEMKKLLEQLTKDERQLPTGPNPKKEGSQAPHP